MIRLLYFFIGAALVLSGCGQRELPPQSVPEPESASSAIREEIASPAEEPDAAPPAEQAQPGGEAAGAGPQSGPEAASGPSVPAVEILRITIPEGYTLARIGMMLEEREICTAEEFIDTAQNGEFAGYPLLTARNADPNRCFFLEGYLFPDTYEIYSAQSPDAIIRRMLDHTEKKISPELRARIEADGRTVDEIITLASIIEKEAFGHEQMPGISSVLHNRLEAGMKLQCDVTIAYVEGAVKPFITGDIDRYNEHYNTYKCEALPAGAICNPGMDAILAAVDPAESDYLFFLTDSDKNYYYAATYEEHQENARQAGLL